mmetsp:Transcript_36850/g.106142  ORF Transcript_36850/g.106142 Transcript_36850/m.106142 type:complete len:200 (+) Transcript_36850:1765-2364(+)
MAALVQHGPQRCIDLRTELNFLAEPGEEEHRVVNRQRDADEDHHRGGEGRDGYNVLREGNEQAHGCRDRAQQAERGHQAEPPGAYTVEENQKGQRHHEDVFRLQVVLRGLERVLEHRQRARDPHSHRRFRGAPLAVQVGDEAPQLVQHLAQHLLVLREDLPCQLEQHRPVRRRQHRTCLVPPCGRSSVLQVIGPVLHDA